VLERLREVAEGEAAAPQGVLGLGAEQAGTEPGGKRARVKGDIAQPAEIEADHALAAAAARLDPADHAGTAPERDYRDLLGGTGREQRRDPGLIGKYDRVGGMLE